MLGRFGDRAFEFLTPLLGRLIGPRVDQIERVTIEDRTRDSDRIERFLRGMQTAELFQFRVVERLYAQ